MKFKIIKKFAKFLSDNAPTVLSGVAVGGVVGSVICMRNATLKAEKVLEEYKKKKKDTSKITLKEKIKNTWIYYIPVVLTSGLTIAAIISSNIISKRRLTALTVLCSSAEAALGQYQDKVEELLGKNKAKKIKDEINQDVVANAKLDEDNVIDTGYGNTLCFDKFTGRYFKCDVERIRRAQNEVNMELIGGGEISLNEFYDRIGLENGGCGDLVGFDDASPMDIDFCSGLKDGNKPVLVLEYKVKPIWFDDMLRYTRI